MTIIGLTTSSTTVRPVAVPAPLGLLRANIAALFRAVARHQLRRSIIRLRRCPAHLLEDMGFDPESVYEAGWADDWRGVEQAHRH